MTIRLRWGYRSGRRYSGGWLNVMIRRNELRRLKLQSIIPPDNLLGRKGSRPRKFHFFGTETRRKIYYHVKTFVETHRKITFGLFGTDPGSNISSTIYRIYSIYSHSIQEIVKMHRLACRNIPRSFKPLKRTYATAAQINVTLHLPSE